jgi:hypothetical protein
MHTLKAMRTLGRQNHAANLWLPLAQTKFLCELQTLQAVVCVRILFVHCICKV